MRRDVSSYSMKMSCLIRPNQRQRRWWRISLARAQISIDWHVNVSYCAFFPCSLLVQRTNWIECEPSTRAAWVIYRFADEKWKRNTAQKTSVCAMFGLRRACFFLSSRKAYNFNRDARAMFTGISEYETVQPALAFKITIICPFRLHFYSHWRWVPECVVVRPHIVIRYIKWRENAPTKWMWMNEMVFLQSFFFFISPSAAIFRWLQRTHKNNWTTVVEREIYIIGSRLRFAWTLPSHRIVCIASSLLRAFDSLRPTDVNVAVLHCGDNVLPI